MSVSKQLIDNVNKIKTTLNEISVYNLDVKTAIELYYELAKKVNEVINELSRFEGVVSDEVIKQNEKLIYLLGEGLKVQVCLKIDELITNGTIQDLINNKIFNDLNNKIDTFKQEVNEQFNTITNEKATKSEVDVERKRIDSFTSLSQGSTTGDAELIDARVGADGVLYNNVGESIRKQFSDVNDYLNVYGVVKIPTLTEGYFIQKDGAAGNNQSSTVTDYIDVLGCKKIKIYNAYLNGDRCICAYNETKDFLTVLATNKGSETIDIIVELPSDTKYIRVTGKPNTSIKIVYSNVHKNVFEKIEDVKTEIEKMKVKVYSDNESFWEQKNITSTGVVTTDFTNSNILSKLIKEKTTIKIPDGFMYAVAKYNADGSWNSRTSWISGAVETVVDWEYSYRIVFVTTYTSSKPLTEMLSNLTLKTYEEPSSEKKEIDFINKFVCSDTGNKIIHFSVDDTWLCIKDITNNSYTSIFENSFLGKLKELHDLYGICVTLNTFNSNTTDTNYSISNVPTKYQSEFQANKSWLKFAFHGEDENSNYTSSIGISDSYDKFVNAIYKLTGDYDCIDTFTRLGFFGGNLKNVLAVKNKTYGIKGLLCADTTSRASYYLNDEQNKIVQSKGKYLDTENELVLLKTITRNNADMIYEIQNNLSYQKYVEIFMHEYEGLPSFESVAKWAKENGYVSAFPSVILN